MSGYVMRTIDMDEYTNALPPNRYSHADEFNLSLAGVVKSRVAPGSGFRVQSLHFGNATPEEGPLVIFYAVSHVPADGNENTLGLSLTYAWPLLPHHVAQRFMDLTVQALYQTCACVC